jgi:histidinol dehydrogenase
MRRFSFTDPSFAAAFKAFLDERRGSPADVDAAVAEVLEAVKTRGIDALLDYARKFDKVELTAETIRVTAEEIEAGAAETPADVREAIAFAAARIRAYHSASVRPTRPGPTRPGSSWAGAGRRSRPWASMFPAVARPIPRPC